MRRPNSFGRFLLVASRFEEHPVFSLVAKAIGLFGFLDGVVQDNIIPTRLEMHVVQIIRGDLVGVEQEAGGLGINVAEQDAANDLCYAELNGVAILKQGQAGGTRIRSARRAVMVVAEWPLAQSRRTARNTVGTDMLAGKYLWNQ